MADLFLQFLKPELIILVPVLYAVGELIKRSKMENSSIPIWLGVFGIALSLLYVLAQSVMADLQAFYAAAFAAVTQGILAAAASVYTYEVIKNAIKEWKDGKDSGNKGDSPPPAAP